MKFNWVDKKSIAGQLQKLVWQAAKKFDKSLKLADVHLEHPENPEHGDYSANIAMAMFAQAQSSKLKARFPNAVRKLAPQSGASSYNLKLKTEKIKAPLDLAKLVVKKLPKADFLEKIEVAPPGFINFWLSKEWLVSQLDRIAQEKDGFGKVTMLKNKKLMVEFAHPNTLKPFHIGHLRNISLGESIVRILEVNGASVVRANYQGDVGLHIAKCLYGILQAQSSKLKSQNYNLKLKTLKTLNQKIEFLGKAYAVGNKAYEEDKKAKEEIIKINERIYNQDPKIMPLWKQTRQWSLDYFDRIYKRVYSRFDRFYFESEVAGPGKEIVLKNLKKGIFEKSQEAVIFNGEKYRLHKRVFINKLGFPTYEAKDMGLGALQFSEFSPDLIVHVVGPEQKGYFEVVFKALEEIFPKIKGKEFHLLYGWVRLKRGKMASRLGNVVLAEWLLDEVKRRLLKEFKMTNEVAEIVAIGAVKYSFLKFSPSREIVFDIDESINMEGDSGPYLQYTYARARSVLRKTQNSKLKTQNYNFKLSEVPPPTVALSEVEGTPRTVGRSGGIGQLTYFGAAVNLEEMAILRTIYKFPEVVREAGESYAPNLICTFLFDLAQKFNGFYNKWPIIKARFSTPRSSGEKTSDVVASSSKLKAQRLALTAATAQVLQNGLHLLGIKTLERM